MRTSGASARGELLSWAAALAAVVGVVAFVPGLVPVDLRSAVGLGPEPLYSFLQHQPGRPDDPVTWDPCREIEFVVNPDQGPDDAESLVTEAVAEASRASGLAFDYQGLSDRRPDQGTLDQSELEQPVLVAWATPSEVADLDGNAGLGGAVSRSVTGGFRYYTTGSVTLNAESFRDLDDRPRGRDRQRAVVLHELGHLLGLGHVDSSAELMHEDNTGRLDYARGDLDGLARLGSGRCF